MRYLQTFQGALCSYKNSCRLKNSRELRISEIKRILSGSEYDEKLSRIYCCDDDELPGYKDRIRKVADSFLNAFDKDETTKAAVFSSPGRAELTGNHTDHQKGKVLTGTVTLDTLAAAASSDDSFVNIISEGFGTIKTGLSETEPVHDEKNTSAALVRGVIRYISDLGYSVSGFNAYITSDVPSGSGLSSSASFSILIAIIINELFCMGKLDVYEMTGAAKYAENVYFGKPCGLMDQTAIALGGINHIDFSDKASAGSSVTGETKAVVEKPAHRRIDFSFKRSGYSIFIIDTGSDHSALSKDFDAVPSEMFAAARALGKNYLDELDENIFRNNISLIRKESGDRAFLRAFHWFNECKRVNKQAEALSSGDIDTFLKLASESGRSSFMYLQNISSYRDPESQPVAVALAAADMLLEGKGAFRVHGGGFAGTIIAFVPVDHAEAFRSGMNDILGFDACREVRIRPEGACVLMK